MLSQIVMTHAKGSKSNAVLEASVIAMILALSIAVYPALQLRVAADRIHNEDDMTGTRSIP